MRHLIALCLLFSVQQLAAQQPSVKQLRETALNFQRQEDFGNALMILSRALEMEPLNLSLLKDIANTLYLAGDYKQAATRILPLTDRTDADEQVFQIAGDIYTIQEDWKQADKVYKKGLKKFPLSGPLYSKYGEMFWLQEKPADAIAQWENGLKADPVYPLNYYHAAKFYFTTADKARSIIELSLRLSAIIFEWGDRDHGGGVERATVRFQLGHVKTKPRERQEAVMTSHFIV
jgi:predicted Zn-dependent protease